MEQGSRLTRHTSFHDSHVRLKTNNESIRSPQDRARCLQSTLQLGHYEQWMSLGPGSIELPMASKKG